MRVTFDRHRHGQRRDVTRIREDVDAERGGVAPVALGADAQAVGGARTHFFLDNETPKARYGHMWWIGWHYDLPPWHDYDQPFDRWMCEQSDPNDDSDEPVPYQRRPYLQILAIQHAHGALGFWAHPTSWWRGDKGRFITNLATEMPAHAIAHGKRPDGTDHRLTRLAVKEGDRVKAGQFLLQIDPVAAQSAVRRDEAAVAGARTALEQARAMLKSAEAQLELARQTLKRQEDLWAAGLTPRESLDRARNEVEVREADLGAREQEIRTRQEQLRQVEAAQNAYVDAVQSLMERYAWVADKVHRRKMAREAARSVLPNATEVKIVVSGGFTVEKIRQFEQQGVPADVYGVGSSLFQGRFDFTADVVMLEGKPCAKVGRSYRPNPRLERVQ